MHEKTPGGENISIHQALIFLSLDLNSPRQCASLVAFRYDNFVDQHIVATLGVMNTNLRIFFYFRGIDDTSIRSHIGDRFAKLVACGFACFRSQDNGLARSEVGNGTEAFGCCGRRL